VLRHGRTRRNTHPVGWQEVPTNAGQTGESVSLGRLQERETTDDQREAHGEIERPHISVHHGDPSLTS
jgi:hypothetical protein